MSDNRIICIKCGRRMEVRAANFAVKAYGEVEMVWVGELLECPVCEVQVAANFGTLLDPQKAEIWRDKALQLQPENGLTIEGAQDTDDDAYF